MKRTILTIITLVFVSIAPVALTGCWAVAAGAAGGTVAYVMGDLEAVRAEGLDQVYQATLDAMQQLEFSVTSKQKDALQAEVIARNAADKKITVEMEKSTEDTTSINIRVGLFGDEEKSRMIYEKIVENL